MKILYIITQADGAGAQKYVFTMAKHFNGIIAAGEGEELFLWAKREGVASVRLQHLKRNLNPWQDILGFWEIYRLIKKTNPDIVHLNSSKAGFIGSIAGKLAGKKIVFTAHGMYFFKNTGWLIKKSYTLLEIFASKFRDRIIAVSDEDKNLAITHGLLPAQKIIRIYNGIAPINFTQRELAQKTLNINPAKISLVNVAQLYTRKGQDVLLTALSILPKEIKNQLVLYIFGTGPEKQKLEDLAIKLQLNGLVFFKGFDEKISFLFKAFDIFVLSSRKEGLPYVLLESMQAGLPVIATDAGGVKEVLGKAGVLVPNEDSGALAETIILLVKNSQLRKNLAELSKQEVQKFSQTQMLEETKKVYEQLLLHK